LTRLLAIALVALLAACARAVPAVAPVWERPGLGGAVRPEMGSPQPGEAAPELALPDLDGRTVTLASMRGSWVVVHFTATWCPFCDSEVAHLGELADAMAPRGVRTVIVDLEEDERAWRAYAGTHVAPSLVALHDATGTASARFAPPRAQPSFDDRAQVVLDATIVIDPGGVIRLFLLPDSAHFEPTFRAVRAELDVLVPPPIVAVAPVPVTVAAGEHADLVVRLDVAPGYHVMSDRPSEPSYVPTRVAVEAADGVGTGEAVYPAPSSFSLVDRTIATFAGAVEVRVPLVVEEGAAPGTRRLRGTLRYQACTATRCVVPASRAFEATVAIANRPAPPSGQGPAPGP
jgi:peroxiredoxin